MKELLDRKQLNAIFILTDNQGHPGWELAARLGMKPNNLTRDVIKPLEQAGIIYHKIRPTTRPESSHPNKKEKAYFILNDAYDDIYKKLKKYDYVFVPVVEGNVIDHTDEGIRIVKKKAKLVVSHPFPPNVDRRFPGEDYCSYILRTGFSDLCLARACKEQFTEYRLATEEEVALFNILKNCSGLAREKEESEREYDKYSKGYALGPAYAEK